MLNGTFYDISSKFALKIQNARVHIKLFLLTEDTSNHTIKISKNKLLMDGRPVVVPDKIVHMHQRMIQKSQPSGLKIY